MEDEHAPVPLLSSEGTDISSNHNENHNDNNNELVASSSNETQPLNVAVDVDVDVELQSYEEQDGFPLSEQDRMRYISTIRNKSRVLITVLIPVLVSLCICVLIDSKKQCEKPLEWWGSAGALLMTVCTFFQFLILRQTRNWDRIPFLLIRLNQLIYCSLFAWYVTGCVWVFTLIDKHGTCRASAPNIYRMALSIVIMGLILAGLTFFCCCFCLTHITYQLYRAFLAFREKQPKGATQKVIDQLVAKIWPVQNIEGEDALCAICLGEYEEKEVLRFLPCKHHFHAECVDTWLLKNASCPLCKYSILEPPSAENNTNQPTQNPATISPTSPSSDEASDISPPSTNLQSTPPSTSAPLLQFSSENNVSSHLVDTNSSSSSTAGENWTITIPSTSSTGSST
eukprot:TRINITY_DN4532_c0_g1_i2.p1 TRINITY_DN4532_c0_g1~~TRINITY_DN4532_c0_g1_i2.p1  ORF type:complete len:398 (-),score=70.27 TRINITY_DN4532_c0_g1_i2:229-1422(-)